VEDNVNLVTREQYIEMLIDASFKDAAEIEFGLLSWCERHSATWREQGYDEMWIRQRIETAQASRGLHRTLKEQGLTMLEIRETLRKTYEDYPELYDLAIARERVQPGPLRYRGNTSNLRQRYTLRVLVYETDKLAYGQFCRWSGLPVPDPKKSFLEQPENIRVVRDLSTVEELEMMLTMSKYALRLFDGLGECTKDQIALRMEAYGRQLRAAFIAKHGYKPEDSATPYIPVTINGPQDHDVYYAKEYP
jgi:hypothetical protein